MNDFERKLRQQTFREPPADLRATIFGPRPMVIRPARWTWRDWFWPSPQAWGALAALWLIFAALAWRDQPDASSSVTSAPPPARGESAFYVFQHASQSSHVLELTN